MLRGLSDRLKLRRGNAADRDGATAAAATAVGAGAAEPAPRHASLPHPDSGILVGGGSTEAEAKAALAELAPGYFDPQFDALEHELRQLPVDFDQAALEAVAEERTGVLEVVSERLSAHVISHYDKFVAGVDEVTQVEAQLQVAHLTAKQARERLALAQRQVASNLKIAKDTRRKQGLTALLETLLKLQQASKLHKALKEAQENGEYAEAFWLCAQCVRSMEELGDGLKVAQQLTVTCNRLYAETTQRLEGALAAACGDFRPAHYTRVLEGYMFLGNLGQLGDEVKSAFIATLNTSAAKVVRGVLLTRPGYEEKAAGASSLQELVRVLPSDLLRTCLARVLMVLFDILVSHFHMVRWHEAALEKHAADAAALAAARRQLVERLSGGSSAEGELISSTVEEEGPAVAAGGRDGQPEESPQQGLWPADLLGSPNYSGEALPPVTGRAVMQLQRGTASELEEVEAKASDEAEWGVVLQAVHTGLLSGRRLIWEEAARRIAVLLSCPAAFEGEHFLQVMEWTQRVLAVGEAFSGVEDHALRALLERQSAKFFRLYHHSNIEALSSMLDKELWKLLPAPLPSIVDALAARTSSSDEGGGGGMDRSGSPGHLDAAPPGPPGDYAAFEAVVVQGNPWRKQQTPRRRRALAQLGFGGSAAGGADDGRAARQLEVDEYGMPLGPSPGGALGSAAPNRGGSAQSEGAGGGTSGSELIDLGEEASEVYGDYIDEDSGAVRRRSNGHDLTGAAGRGGDAPPAVTNSSLRCARWMRDYAALMLPLRAAAPTVFAGLAELFELYLLHVFVTFSDISLAELQHAQAAQQHAHAAVGCGTGVLGGMGAHGGSGAANSPSAAAGTAAEATLTPRLRAALLRISGESIGKYQQLLAAQPGSRLARALTGASAAAHAGGAAAAATGAGASSGGGASQYFRRTLPTSTGSSSAVPGAGLAPAASQPGALQPPGASPAAPPGVGPAAAAAAAQPPAEISVLSNAGNLYGLLERIAAAECLLAVGAQLHSARGALAAALPPGEGTALDVFFSRTVGAAEDLRDFVVASGARLLLPLRWLPERLGGTDWMLSEPPTAHGTWVDDLGRQLELLRDRLAQVPGLSHAALCQLWAAVAAHVADACLNGFSRCKRCSLEGRAAMSLDLQGVGRTLQRLLPPEVPVNLRLADSYVKAFYIPLTELPHWAQAHPEYTAPQVLLLTGCIAESGGLKKRDKAALLAQVANNLQAMRLDGEPGAGA